MIKKIKNLVNSLCNYKIFAMLLLGFSAGIPLAMTGSTLSMWLSRLDMDVKTIGLFALVGIPFSLKFLWAFLFDNIPIPYFSKRFGFRRSWLILVQFCLIIAIIALGQTSPAENISLTAIVAFIVATCSATQDIIIDALRIEALEKEEQGLGVSMYVYGYRIAMLVSGAGSLLLADYISWDLVFLIMGFSIFVGVIAVIFLTEPAYSKERLANLEKVNLGEMFAIIALKPIIDFCKRSQWYYILLFVVFYKFSDTLLMTLQSKFYVTMGFSNSEIAYITKGFGFIMTLVGLFAGGVIFYKTNIFKSLFIAGVLQILSNLVFIWVAQQQHDIFALSVAIAIENFTGAINTVVIVAYLSSLCNITYTATQYALLSSVSAIGRTIMAAPAGYIVESFGWINFFWITAVFGIPALILLFIIFKEPKYANQ
jgi:PAT family beta-lactamase induction signal transducer AmpG